MKFTREDVEGQYTIHSYQEGEVILNARPGDEGQDEDGHLALQQSFIVAPTMLIREWPVLTVAQLKQEDLAPLKGMGLEVLLLGTGRTLLFPAPEQLAALVELNTGYEVMDSAAACRTYNILASEGRHVAAAIIVE